jgi:hypothetical protein
MFDNLREQPDSEPFDSDAFDSTPFESTPFYEEEGKFRDAEAAKPVAPMKAPKAAASERRFLGMTAFQRFVLALLLFIAVCVLGSMLLVLTGKIGLM